MGIDVVRYHTFGNPPDVLTGDRKTKAPLKRGEVRVRMSACPINPSDLIPVRGAYPHRTELPAVPGFEGVGTVEEVGPGVTTQWLGRRVLPLRGEGTWQRSIRCSADVMVSVPSSIHDDAACQLYINPLTAWIICTEILSVKPGDVILVNACGSTLGRLFAQLAAFLDFRLIAVVRNDRHTSALEAFGAWRVLNTSEQPLYESVQAWTSGEGAIAAVDSVGGKDGEALFDCVRQGGTVLSVGLLSGVPVNGGELARKTGTRSRLFLLKHWIERVSVDEWHQMFTRVMDLVIQGRLRIREPWRRYPLNQFKEAAAAAESAERQGKVLLQGATDSPSS